MTNGCGLERLEFINRFTSILPGDPETRNYCRQLAGGGTSFASVF
jgi:hypothetical protein